MARLTAALLPLVAVSVLAGAATAAADPLGLVPGEAYLRAQVKEPVFAWVLALVEADSLGTWAADDVQAFAAGWDHPSVFPLAKLVSLRREALPDSARIEREGLVCDRRVVIELDAPRLDMPMPYSILGYRPGKLSFGSPLVAQEWRVGEREVLVRGRQEARRARVEGLVVFAIVSGWTVLDVDGWLDSLLGDKLDDSATVGFAAARGEGRLLGVANSIGRDGRFIFGEMDFRAGTIAPHGRPLARAMAGLVRRWSDPPPDRRPAVWAGYDTPPE
ncbi:MAG: hypothetical protein IH621_03930 [Krumholzibacteria bacterium]|nr:hypothetical protein [Candidatus Krumholzibacteria bacterium]